MKIKRFLFRFIFLLFLLSLYSSIGFTFANVDTTNWPPARTVISGKMMNFSKPDSIYLKIFATPLSLEYRKVFQPLEYMHFSEDGSFYFEIDDLPSYSYFGLYCGVNPKTGLPSPVFAKIPSLAEEVLLICSGNEVCIDIYKDSIAARGNNGANITVQYQLAKQMRMKRLQLQSVSERPILVLQGKSIVEVDNIHTSKKDEKIVYESQINLLGKFEGRIPTHFFDVLKQNLKYRYYGAVLLLLGNPYQFLTVRSKDTIFTSKNRERILFELDKLKKYYDREEINIFRRAVLSNDRFVSQDAYYYYRRLAVFNTLPLSDDVEEYEDFVIRHYAENVESQILASYVIDNIKVVGEKERRRLTGLIRNSEIRNALITAGDENWVGEKAYPFELLNKQGEVIKLRDFDGKVVVVDFWFTGCKGCIKYYEEVLSRVEEKYKNNVDVVFVTICVDGKFEMFKESLENDIYTSSDKINVFNLSTAPLGASHPMVEYYRIPSYPRPFIIGKDAKIFSYDLYSLRKEILLTQLIDRALLAPNPQPSR